ncbi:MAG: hypothetical protein Q7U04_12480, partial [Bacteriovorax sp.]|nr:hypothetical protein [Bacteriovorax sp.]
MKHVLIITPYRNLVGGVEVVTKNLADLLESKGMVVEYLTSDNLKANSLKDILFVKIFGLPYLTAKSFKQRADRDKIDFVICNGEFSFGIKHSNAIVYFHGSYFGLKKFNGHMLGIKNKIA